jgi:sec-independent protein translocase protein TatA
MGAFSIWHWLIVLAVVLLLFGGGGKIPKLMKDLGSGINAFKKGMNDEKKAADKDGEEATSEPKTIEATAQSNTAESGSNEERKTANG